MGFSCIRLSGLFEFMFNRNNARMTYDKLLWTDQEHMEAAEVDMRTRDGMICALQISKIYAHKINKWDCLRITGHERNTIVSVTAPIIITDDMRDRADELAEQYLDLLRSGVLVSDLDNDRMWAKGFLNDNENSNGNVFGGADDDEEDVVDT